VRQALEDAYVALQEIAPLLDRMNEMEEEEARLARLLAEFATVVERRVLCRRCGGRVPAGALVCQVCGVPMPRGRL